MTEDLKLFGEVGLGYSQLQKDAEAINDLILGINKNINTLGEDLKKKNIDINVKFDPNSKKQLNDIAKAIEHIENKTTKANAAAKNMTDGFNQITSKAANMRKEFESASNAVEKFNKSGAFKDPLKGVISSSTDSIKKELEAYFNEVNKLPTKQFNLDNVGKAINDELKYAVRGTEEFNRAMEMSGKYVSIAGTQLGEYENKLISLQKRLSMAPDAETLKKKFLSGSSLSESDLERRVEGLNGTIQRRARSAAVEYVDEFGRTIGETWTTKAGQFLPSTTKILLDPLKQEANELGKVFENSAKTYNAVNNKMRSEQKKVHQENIANIKKEEELREKANKAVDPSKVKNMGQTIAELYAVKRVLQDTVKIAADFQEKQIEVERIAQNNTKDAKELKKAIFDISKETGTMVSDTQEVAALWARTGKSGEQLKEAVKTTMIGFNVANFKDAETAVASINAIVNQMYNGDATKSQSILDSLVKVADKTAVRNVEDLAEVASRAGANAKSLKMDLHQLNAVSSIVMENMKIDGNVLGTQLKSVFAYMMNDGRMKKLRTFGVEMTKNNENGTKSLKSFAEAFGDVVKKYKEFMATGDEKRANDLLSTIGGTRFTPMIKNLADNWDKFEARVALSKDSAGFSLDQNAKKMESLNKQILALKASATQLIVSIGESGILQGITFVTKGIKGFVDMLNKIPGAANAVIPMLTALQVAVTSLYIGSKIGLREGSLLYYLLNGASIGNGGFKIPGLKDGIQKFKDLRTEANVAETAVSAVGRGMANAGKDASSMVSEVGKAGKAVEDVEGASKGFLSAVVNSGSVIGGLRTAMQGANTAIAGIAANIGLTAPQFAVLAAVVTAAGVALYQFKKKNDELVDKTLSGKFDKDLESIENMHNAYMKLQNDADAFKEGTGEHEQLVDVQNRLAEALGASKEAYSAESSTIKQTNQAIEARLALKKAEIEAEKQQGLEAAQAYLNKANQRVGFSALDDSLVVKAEKVKQAVSLLERTSQKLEELDKKGVSGKQKVSALKSHEEALTDLRKSYEEFLPVYEKTKKAGEVLGDPDAADNILKENGYGNILSTVIEKLKEKTQASKEAAEGSDEHKLSIEQEKEALKELAQECDNCASKVSAMDSARKEYNESGELSLGTVTKLVSEYPELAQCIEKVGDKYKLNKQFLEEQNKVMDEQKEKVDELYNQARGNNNDNVGSVGKAITETVNSQVIDDFIGKLKELDMETYNTVSNLSQQFMNGEISATQFFNSLSTSLQSVDFSKLSPTEIQNFSNAISTYLTNAVQTLDSQLQSGTITREEYNRQIGSIRQKALDLYTALNNLNYVNGSWVDSNGKADKYANDLQKLIKSTRDTKKEMGDAKRYVDDFNMSLSEVGNFDLDLSGFSESFSNAFSELEKSFNESWESMVENSGGYVGDVLDNVADMLDGINIGGTEAFSALLSTISGMFKGLVKSTTDSGNQTLGVIRNIGSSLASTTFSFLAHSTFGTPMDFNLGNLLGGLLKGKLLDSFGFIFDGKGKARTMNMSGIPGGGYSSHAVAAKRSSNRLPTFMTESLVGKTSYQKYLHRDSGKSSFSKFFNKLFEVEDTMPTRLKKQRQKKKSSRKKSSSDSSGSSDSSSIDRDILPRDSHGSGGGGSGKGRGRGGGGGGSKGSSSKQDIPEKVQKQIDDLRHKLDMDEITQYQYSKEVEKIFDKNKSILTEKGVRQLEKMIYDAKKGGVKEGFRAHIEELKDLNDLAEQTIQSLESEKQMIESLKLNPNLKFRVNENLTEVYAGKLTISMSLMRKYKLAIDEIDNELRTLNSSSVGYSKTVEELNKVKNDYLKKLHEEESQLNKIKEATAKLALEIHSLKQAQIDEAFDELSTIERHTIDMINARNDKIREKTQERHRQEMDDLQKANDAKDKAHRKQMDRMQREADAFRRYMEDKMKMLNREYAKDDYDDQIKKKRKEITELKDRINLHSLDDSYKAKGDVIKLKKELNAKEEELEKMKKDRERTLTQEALQDQLTEYERGLQQKQKKMDDDSQAFQEKNNNELELLRKRQDAEMKALEETMNAKAVALEAEQAMHTGLVRNIEGQSVDLRNAIISHMQEIGQWIGILGEKAQREFDAIWRHQRNSMQLLGVGGRDGLGSLQQQLGLTDDSYMEWKYDVAKKTGISVDDVEQYITNKMSWERSSPEERQRLAHENHLIRKKIVDAHGGDQRYNLDKNGEVFHYKDLLPSKEDKRWNFIQDNPRFSPNGGMTAKGSRELAELHTALALHPEKSYEIHAQIENLRRREPAARPYSLGDITGYKLAGDLERIGRAKNILDIPASQLETSEIRRRLEQQRRDIENAQNGGSYYGGSGGSASVDYNRMVNDIMGGASQKKKDFVRKILPKILETSKKYNLNPSAMIGQAIIESGWGTSGAAKNRNALFGIMGRSYNSWDESIEDYAYMLSGRDGKGKYAVKQLQGVSNPEEYLRRLQDKSLGGFEYCASPSGQTYSNSVLNAINSNNIRGFNNVDPYRYMSYGGDQSARERFLAEAHKQDGMPYSMDLNARQTTHRDCSSYVYFATKNAGLYSGNIFATGNMREALAKDGWKDLGAIPKDQIRRGDIFWYVGGGVHHTEIATEDGTLKSTGAHRPGKVAGDSSWIYKYHILRHPSLNPFRNGGIADFTGPAMLHGTKSSPEYIFNTPQFEALGKLVAQYATAPSVYAPRDLSRTYEPIMTVQVENLVQINGNADRDTAREIRNASNDVLENLTKALRKRGK